PHRLAAGHSCQLARKGNKRQCVHAGNMTVDLRHETYSLANRHALGRNIAPQHGTSARRRLEKAEQGLDERGLPRAVRTEQADAALRDLDGEVVDGSLASIA